ncbi:MAG: hypothetical protein DRI75_11370 [Bacteroidetes bacterium]|nr:MAG: hypothetical protein DRI75_11370 [Bacteroidota bacterium]
MSDLEKDFIIELNGLEIKELINLLEDSVNRIWALLPFKEIELKKHEQKMAVNAEKIKSGKRNFFSNFEESFFNSKREYNKIQSEIYSDNQKKKSLNDLYLKLNQLFYSDSGFWMETAKENYDRWNTKAKIS